MIGKIFTTALSPEQITFEVAKKYLQRHSQNEIKRLNTLENYYNGEHAILNRTKPSADLSNIKIVTNYAAYIANFTSAYLLGEPVSYAAKDNTDITALTETLEKADSATQDADLALDLAIYGRSYELVYMSSDERPFPKLARINPQNAFVVYDDTVEQNPVFGLYYFPYTTEQNTTQYKVCLITERIEEHYITDEYFGLLETTETKENPFGMVTLNEIYNNGQRGGDFEQVISLIDADNLLQSDRINDKEQFVNALLVLKGVALGDSNEEKKETLNALKDEGVMELPAEGADAAYLTRQFDENSIETLRMSVVNDIHKISCVPDMSDKNFASNSSGVAMRYKLIGLEQLTKTKERYFAEGLKYRLQLFSNILTTQGGAFIDLSKINITFKRSLPVNEVEEAQIVNMLDGNVPQKLLLSRLSFVKDPEAAIKELEKEKEADIKNQQSMFMNSPLYEET